VDAIATTPPAGPLRIALSPEYFSPTVKPPSDCMNSIRPGSLEKLAVYPSTYFLTWGDKYASAHEDVARLQILMFGLKSEEIDTKSNPSSPAISATLRSWPFPVIS
jgi:hypothetical protein